MQLLANRSYIHRHAHDRVGADHLQRVNFFERADTPGDDQPSRSYASQISGDVQRKAGERSFRIDVSIEKRAAIWLQDLHHGPWLDAGIFLPAVNRDSAATGVDGECQMVAAEIPAALFGKCSVDPAVLD